MPVNQLVLHPRDPDAAPEPYLLRERLAEIDFIDPQPFRFDGNPHYRPGGEFLQQVTFLGCSPVVALGAPGPTGEEFCHIAFSGPYPEARLIAGDNVKTPRCRGCNQPLQGWQESTQSWLEKSVEPAPCPHCGRTDPPPAWRWRQSAGIGRVFVRVWGIFEGEAVPGERLLGHLAEAGSGDWTYFYLRKR